jgi:hypothetical protein
LIGDEEQERPGKEGEGAGRCAELHPGNAQEVEGVDDGSGGSAGRRNAKSAGEEVHAGCHEDELDQELKAEADGAAEEDLGDDERVEGFRDAVGGERRAAQDAGVPEGHVAGAPLADGLHAQGVELVDGVVELEVVRLADAE